MQTVSDTIGGNLDLNDVARLFDCKNHPDHLSGLKSKATLVREFMDAISCDEVLAARFANYHRSVAACTTESQFDAMVRLSALPHTFSMLLSSALSALLLESCAALRLEYDPSRVACWAIMRSAQVRSCWHLEDTPAQRTRYLSTASRPASATRADSFAHQPTQMQPPARQGIVRSC